MTKVELDQHCTVMVVEQPIIWIRSLNTRQNHHPPAISRIRLGNMGWEGCWDVVRLEVFTKLQKLGERRH